MSNIFQWLFFSVQYFSPSGALCDLTGSDSFREGHTERRHNITMVAFEQGTYGTVTTFL